MCMFDSGPAQIHNAAVQNLDDTDDRSDQDTAMHGVVGPLVLTGAGRIIRAMILPPSLQSI